jgi:hypothetical protein
MIVGPDRAGLIEAAKRYLDAVGQHLFVHAERAAAARTESAFGVCR